MNTHDRRPVFLSLHQIRLPVNGLVSILHRISGMVMFFSLPVLLCMASCSLKSAPHFSKVVASISQPSGWGLVFYAILLAWVYHGLAGVRHLIMDLGWGESLSASRAMSFMVLWIFAVVAWALGSWLW